MFPYIYLLLVYAALFCLSKVIFYWHQTRKMKNNKNEPKPSNSFSFLTKKKFALNFNNFFADLIKFP